MKQGYDLEHFKKQNKQVESLCNLTSTFCHLHKTIARKKIKTVAKAFLETQSTSGARQIIFYARNVLYYVRKPLEMEDLNVQHAGNPLKMGLNGRI
ncbi:MAG: hypothetical protein GY714_32430 [Desulfobacterales bacterium]|nr:hypothetical protein [Desulfobacterales bacterium]